ncbi:ribosomal protein L10-domain-containing protein [Lipomyces doorenjongii]
MGGTREKKSEYFTKLRSLLEEYKSIFIVGVDNVSSQQMHEIRKALRGQGVILMGKNTMVRRAIRGFLSDFPEFERLLPHVRGNVGFVFTNADLKEIREVIIANKVAAPARAGAVAPKDVWIPAGNTGMEPGKTSFFQALGVPTKIARGTIEITSDVQVVSTGNKVGASEATLLNMLNISPFTYGMAVLQVYDQGQAFSPEILDIEEETLIKSFTSAITTITTISLAIGYPTLPAVIHSVINHYKKVLAVSIATDYTFDGSEAIKDRIANPEAYAAAAAPVAAAAGVEDVAPAAEEAPAEEAEESDDDMGFGLFD